MIKSSFILLLVVVVVFVVFFFLNWSASSNPFVVTQTISETEEVAGNISYTIDVKYPQLAGLRDSDKSRAINDELHSLAQKTVDSFHSRVNETSALFVESPEIAPESPAEYLLNSSFEVYRIDKNLVSIRITDTEYLGGAHSNTFTEAFNYSLMSQSYISLADLFLPNTDYKSFIVDTVWNKLADMPETFVAQAESSGEGTLALVTRDSLLENFEIEFSNFFILDDGILFVFDPYQVAPYAAGIIEIQLPYSSIPNVIRIDD